jgi:hypothetical protein
VTRSEAAKGETTSFPTKLQHQQRIRETQSLNGIAVWKFKTFSSGARLASGDMERVSGTITGLFELKQPKMAIHKEERKDYPWGFSSSYRNPAGITASTMLPGRTVPGGPFQLLKMASQDKTLNNETEEPPAVETTTIETTGAVLGRPRYRHFIMMSGLDRDLMEMETWAMEV